MKRIFLLLFCSAMASAVIAKGNFKELKAEGSEKVISTELPDLKMIEGCTKTGQTPSPYYDDFVFCSATAPTCEIAQDMVNRCLLAGLFEQPTQP